jgi:predicted nuclease of predicted toxin-antitoxin system
MVSLLVDMNLSTEWIPLLRAAGHQAVHWSEVGDPRAPDMVLMQWSIANGYAVFTHDLDFGTMLSLSGTDGPSVLQVRCLNVLPEAIGTLVLSLLKTYGAEIEQGALVVADERRLRVRIPAPEADELSRQGQGNRASTGARIWRGSWAVPCLGLRPRSRGLKLQLRSGPTSMRAPCSRPAAARSA